MRNSISTVSIIMRRALMGDDHLDVTATIYNAGYTHHQLGELIKTMKFYCERQYGDIFSFGLSSLSRLHFHLSPFGLRFRRHK